MPTVICGLLKLNYLWRLSCDNNSAAEATSRKLLLTVGSIRKNGFNPGCYCTKTMAHTGPQYFKVRNRGYADAEQS
jgi:hypothetical protein